MRLGKIVAVGALAACLAGAAAADEIKDVKTVARATAAKAGKAVVTVKLVLKVKMGGARGGRDTEQKIEVTGTVIDPSGLTVVSASAVEPASLLGGRGGGGRRGGGGGADGGGEMPRIETEVSETSLILEDGTEVEADVVLKDADLDVAFVKPRAAQKLDAVELKPRGRAPELLEDIFSVTRLGRGEGRATAVAIGSVKAVVKGPRTYYICTPEVTSGATGCIAYGADGAMVGIFGVKVNTAGGEGGGFGRGGGRDVAVVMRPIEDILDIAKQAKEAKAPERKPAPEKPAATDEKKPEAGKPASGPGVIGEPTDKGEKPTEPR